jgi:hypothetical protein
MSRPGDGIALDKDAGRVPISANAGQPVALANAIFEYPEAATTVSVVTALFGCSPR